jgi:hypothetical protein
VVDCVYPRLFQSTCPFTDPTLEFHFFDRDIGSIFLKRTRLYVGFVHLCECECALAVDDEFISQ